MEYLIMDFIVMAVLVSGLIKAISDSNNGKETDANVTIAILLVFMFLAYIIK